MPQVIVENQACGSTGVTCTKSVTVTVGQDDNTVTYTMLKDRELTRTLNGGPTNQKFSIPHNDPDIS